MQLYCRVEVVVRDPGAVTSRAIRELREADIDWAVEEDNVDTAAGEIKADLAQALASVVDPFRMVEGVPGVAARRGRIWAEFGDPHPRFQPGFADID